MSSKSPRRDDRGAVSVEMALSMPILVFFFIGATAFTHAAFVRYVLTGQAHAAARVCSLEHSELEACKAMAQQIMVGAAKSCSPFSVNPRIEPLAGLEHTKLLALDVRCNYSLFSGFFAKLGMPLLDLSVTVVVPY